MVELASKLLSCDIGRLCALKQKCVVTQPTADRMLHQKNNKNVHCADGNNCAFGLTLIHWTSTRGTASLQLRRF